MSSRRTPRQLIVAVLVGVLVGGGLLAITPAGAEVSQSVATNWKKIWKKNLKPLADRRYYKKSTSNAKYAGKAEAAAGAAAAQAAALAAANAATDSKLGGYYKKADAEAKFAPYPAVIRGTVWGLNSTSIAVPISFGYTLSAAPTTHLIAIGDPPPVGCSGTAALPDASPGHFCVFITANNASGVPSLNRSSDGIAGADPFGASLVVSTGAQSYIRGTWAVRPLTLAPSGSPGRTNPVQSGTSDALGRVD